MEPKNRRIFIKKAGLLTAGMILGDSVTGRSPEEIRSMIKTGINAWSYYVPLYKHINGEAGGMSLFGLLEECARLGVDSVDPTGYFFPGYPEKPERGFINEFKRRAFRLGLAFSGTGIRNDFATADKEKRMADMELAKRWIEVASELGAPVLRVFAGKQPEDCSWEEASLWMAEALAGCADYGSKFGVMVGVQNHGDMLKSAGEVLKIMEMVKSDWLGTIADTGFFLTPDPYTDIERVIPYAVNFQVKELLSDRQGGPIDMVRLVNILRRLGYRGYVPVETLPLPGKEEEYDAFARVPELLARMRNALDQT